MSHPVTGASDISQTDGFGWCGSSYGNTRQPGCEEEGTDGESHISGPFDQRTAAIARGYFLGDYAGLSVADSSDVFHAVFGQSTGTPPAHESDIEASDAAEEG
jgi:hypothetical protein